MNLLTGSLPSLIAVVLTVGVGGFVYVVACFRTGVREADMVLRGATSALALSRRLNEAFLIYDHCHAQLSP